MKLITIKIEGLRCFLSEVVIPIEDLTALIGKNDVGKSTVFDALSYFFGEKLPDVNDLAKNGSNSELSVTCVFNLLPQEIVLDSSHKTSLKDEFLLNENGYLEIKKVFAGTGQTLRLKDVLAICMHPSVDNYSDLLSLKINQLRVKAEELSIDTNSINLNISSEIRKAIWKALPDLKLTSTEISLDKAKEGLKDIWTNLEKYLPVFAVFKSDRESSDQDTEAQDPMKTAVKEALKSKEIELKKIEEYVLDQVSTIAKATVDKLREMDPSLASELRPLFPQTLKWDTLFKPSLTDDSQIPLNKRGSGVRRLVLLNFFRAKAEKLIQDDGATSVIYAIEEPETSQHPDNQRLLMRSLLELSEEPNRQILLTTHTPMLGRLLPSKSLLFIDRDELGNRQIRCPSEDTYHKIKAALGVLPDHNVKLFLGVEGSNDINFFKSLSKKLSLEDNRICNLEELEHQGLVVFIPLGGSSLGLWATRLAGLNIPEFHFYDRDSQPDEPSKNQDAANVINQANDPNRKAFVTKKREMENYIHSKAIGLSRNIIVAVEDYNDVPNEIARLMCENSGSGKVWDELDITTKKSKESKIKKWLNYQAVSEMTLELLKERDPEEEMLTWLLEISSRLQ